MIDHDRGEWFLNPDSIDEKAMRIAEDATKHRRQVEQEDRAKRDYQEEYRKRVRDGGKKAIPPSKETIAKSRSKHQQAAQKAIKNRETDMVILDRYISQEISKHVTGMNPRHLAVLNYIRSWTFNRDRVCSRSRQEIAEDLGISPSTVKRSIRFLKDQNLIASVGGIAAGRKERLMLTIAVPEYFVDRVTRSRKQANREIAAAAREDAEAGESVPKWGF